MWKKIQEIMRKYRLIVGKYYWDRKKEQKICLDGNFIERNNIKSILFLRQDGKVGDMVVNTMIFREIKKNYPNIKIGVLTRGAAKDILQGNSHVDKIYIFEKEKATIKKISKEIADERYDLVVDFSIMLRVRDMMLIHLCRAKYNIGVNRENWNLFDISISFDFQSHITNLYGVFLEKIGIIDWKVKYELFTKENDYKEEYIVINPYAASKHRSFSRENTLKIARYILDNYNIRVYILGEYSKKQELQILQEQLGEKANYYIGTNIVDIFPLIQKAKLVISPDTSVVHIAVAFQKKLLAIYRKDVGLDKNSVVWGPNWEKANVIFSNEKDINTFSWDEMKEKLHLSLES